LAGQALLDEAPVFTYCINSLQGIQCKRPVLVKLNARAKIDPKKSCKSFNITTQFILRTLSSRRVAGKKFMVQIEHTIAAPIGIAVFMKTAYAVLLMSANASAKMHD
jgi:predicted NAD/FAD-binding protein